MKKPLLSFALVLLVPSFAIAHVSVRPRESKSGAEERYTVRVPTEGVVATTHVQLEIPAGVTVLEVVPAEGTLFQTTNAGDRVTSITWKKEIPPKQAAEFAFRARNPSSGEIVWKAHQHFADGTTADWVGAAEERRPAAVTTLVVASDMEPWRGHRCPPHATDHGCAVSRTSIAPCPGSSWLIVTATGSFFSIRASANETTLLPRTSLVSWVMSNFIGLLRPLTCTSSVARIPLDAAYGFRFIAATVPS